MAFVAYGWVGGSEGASTNPQNHPQPTNNASLPKLGKDATSLLAAVASDVTGSVWLCPSEVIKQVGGRINIVHTYMYEGGKGRIYIVHTYMWEGEGVKCMDLPLGSDQAGGWVGGREERGGSFFSDVRGMMNDDDDLA